MGDAVALECVDDPLPPTLGRARQTRDRRSQSRLQSAMAGGSRERTCHCPTELAVGTAEGRLARDRHVARLPA
jgi:hypothetical protein